MLLSIFPTADVEAEKNLNKSGQFTERYKDDCLLFLFRLDNRQDILPWR